MVYYQSFTAWSRNDIGLMQKNLYAIFWQTMDSLLLAQPEMFWETNLHTFRLLEWKG